MLVLFLNFKTNCILIQVYLGNFNKFYILAEFEFLNLNFIFDTCDKLSNSPVLILYHKHFIEKLQLISIYLDMKKECELLGYKNPFWKQLKTAPNLV